MTKSLPHKYKIRHNDIKHHAHHHTHTIGQRVLPVPKPVTTKVLEQFDEASMQAKQGRQRQLADLRIGARSALAMSVP